MIHRPRITDPEPSRRGPWEWLTTALDWLVALTGLTLLFLGAFWAATGRPDSLSWLLVGALLLVADEGVTLRLRVAHLERWARDRQRER